MTKRTNYQPKYSRAYNLEKWQPYGFARRHIGTIITAAWLSMFVGLVIYLALQVI